MPQKSSFFDSTATDPREYSATEFAEYFSRLVGNGVFAGGTNLAVTANGGETFVSVSLGFGWINGYLYSVYGVPVDLPIAPNTAAQDRIDRVVLRLDTSAPVRSITAAVVEGTPAANPAPPPLTREGNIYELSLAQVRLIANTATVNPALITDERLNNAVCGLVTGLIDQADTTDIFNQFQAWLTAKQAEWQQEWNDFMGTIQDGGFATTTYVDSIANELFQSVGNGKTQVAAAITDKGIPTSANDAFATMAANIEAIQVGVDTSDANLDPAKLVRGYSGYDDGVLKQGTMDAHGGYTDPQGYYADGNGYLYSWIPYGAYLTDSGSGSGTPGIRNYDANFKPENIIGSIFGLQGSAQPKRVASGTGQSPSATRPFIRYDGATITNRYPITVNGLSFTPKTVFILASNYVSIYTAATTEAGQYNGYYIFVNDGIQFRLDGTQAYINNGGFCLPHNIVNNPITWVAIG
ncbi:hypothetical protein COLU111180_06205 [Cohnella lubricantis]|uniref:Uncharacterized protein n=1 Tax=Cohnella lubricantis TaxID=2163172 RepID=A0A841TBX7_9BACL|nr:hypothetical protein [Cohnella lubricantis]MBB6677529.1 hypothetical protein [Cohnella lubricantis]MBP2116585.1 hypothetical protein [Cohnella lubricantis]